MNPQRRANRCGHAALLSQSLENPCGVYHMAHTGLLRRRRRPSTFQSRSSDRKTAGVYHDHHPDTAADAGLRGLLLSRLNRVRWPTFIPAFTGVKPSNSNVSKLSRKCSFQTSIRGLKRETSTLVSGSRACSALPFRTLQDRQASARLSTSSDPPRLVGITWSTSNSRLKTTSGARQYSHRRRARPATTSYSRCGTCA